MPIYRYYISILYRNKTINKEEKEEWKEKMEKTRNDSEEMEIDLLELMMVMKKKLALILLAGIVGLVIMFAYTSILVTPLYSASSMMYVMPDNGSTNSSTLSDMQVGQQLTSDYSSMIKSRSFMEDVIKKLNLTIDYQELLEKVEVANPTSSRILQVTVNDPNPQTAANIANAVASVAETKLKEITGMQAIKIYEEAAVPEKPSSPSLTKNCALGALAGIVLAMAVITVLYLLDDTIKTEDDIDKYLGMTTLAVLPYNGRKQKKQAQKKKKQRSKSKQQRETSRMRKEIETDEFN